jgi:hypothetical protein
LDTPKSKKSLPSSTNALDKNKESRTAIKFQSIREDPG